MRAVASVNRAGPWVLFTLPPGAYSVTAELSGVTRVAKVNVAPHGQGLFPSKAFESNALDFRGEVARDGNHNRRMNSVYSIAQGGIQAATKRFEASATRVAQNPQADLASEFVDQKQAEFAFRANIAVIKTANEMQKSLLDILV